MMDGIGGVYTVHVLEKFGRRFDFVPDLEEIGNPDTIFEEKSWKLGDF